MNWSDGPEDPLFGVLTDSSEPALFTQTNKFTGLSCQKQLLHGDRTGSAGLGESGRTD